MSNSEPDYISKWPDLKIKYLVFASHDFIVFIDDENDVDWQTSDKFDSGFNGDEEKHNAVLNRLAKLESTPYYDLEEKLVINFKRQLGEALVRSFSRDFVNANQMLDLARDFISNRNAQKSRYLYLKASGLTTATVLVLATVSWITRVELIKSIGEMAFLLLVTAFAGALGALLSIILRLGKTEIDHHASKELHYLEGSSRIIAGMISGLLIGLCIQSGLILSAFEGLETNQITMTLGALIAGSSERLAPSIIKKLDGTQEQE